MKRLKHLWILVLFFGLISMPACGKPEEAPPTQNQQAAVDCAQTRAAHQYLLKKHEELEGILKRSQEKQSEYAAAIRILEDAYLEVSTELALVKSFAAVRTGDYEKVLNELAALKAEKKDWGIFAEKEYTRILEEYNELLAIYPPKDFPSTGDLEEWLKNDKTDSHLDLEPNDDGVVNLKGVCEEFALQLVERARESGYIIHFYIMSKQEYFDLTGAELPDGRTHAVTLVIIGNNIYLIEPQTDEYWLVGYLD